MVLRLTDFETMFVMCGLFIIRSNFCIDSWKLKHIKNTRDYVRGSLKFDKSFLFYVNKRIS